MPYVNVNDQEITTRDGKVRIKAGATIYTAEEKENYKRIKENESINGQIHIDSYNHGGFTFLKTVNNAMEKMKPETVGRLAYLSTYLDFGSNRLMAEPNRQMKKNDLQYFLGIGKTRVWNFCDECVEQGIMTIDDEKFLFLDDIFFKGKSSDKNRIKLYGKTIQSLYKHMPVRHHKYFGYVIQLVPWINYEWNIICKNPDECDRDKVIPWTMKEICQFADYDEKNFKRFKDAILKCCFEWKGEPVSMCGQLFTGNKDEIVDGLVVNPHLVFYGTDFKKVEGIAIFFTPHDKEFLEKFKNVNIRDIESKVNS